MTDDKTTLPVVSCYFDFEPADFIWRSYDDTDVTLNAPAACPHCGSVMQVKGEPWWVLFCNNSVCRWWLQAPPPEPKGFHSLTNLGKWSIIKRFNWADKELPSSYLKEYLKEQPALIRDTHHTAFEKLVGDFLKDIYGPIEITHVGGSHDGGRDLYGILTTGEEFLVEVKRRTKSGSVESVDTVRRLLGVMIREGIHRGVIVTSADTFSPDAVEFSIPKEGSSVFYQFDLLKYQDLVQWLNLSNDHDNAPWEKCVSPSEVAVDINIYISRF